MRSRALVVVSVAAIVLIGGSAFAASRWVITSTRQIKPSVLRHLRGARGPRGFTGLTGPQGLPGQQGAPGRSALAPLQSGETIHGTFAVYNDTTADTAELESVTFPVPAPQPVDSLHVVVAGNDPTAGDGCSGSAASPVAAPGFVCIYIANATGTTGAGGFGALSPFGVSSSVATGDGSPYGFIIEVGGMSGFVADGAWAYTAP